MGIAVLSEEPDALHPDDVAVHPASQGHGWGRILIEFAEQEAVRRGYRELRLGTNERMLENIALYTYLGFAETERFTGKSGFQRVCFAKRLSKRPA